MQDVLDRLQTATSELDASAAPDEVAGKAAGVVLRLTRSTQAMVKLDDQTYTARAEPVRPGKENVLTADLRIDGNVLGSIRVSRGSVYTDSERQVLEIFASHVAVAVDSARRLSTRERVERAHELSVQVLLAVSSHAAAGQSLPDFYSRLARTVAELVSARRVLFWRLGEDHMLAPIPGGHGMDRKFVSELKIVRCEPGGKDLASQVVFGDLIFRASRSDASTEFSYVLDALQVEDAISVPWRAGEERLGILSAYDSTRPGGFSREDTWVLQKAGLAAGLVTRLWHTQEELRRLVDRLTKVDGARQMLLKNMTTVVEKERKRVVSELHDDALQKLTAAELQLGRLAREGVNPGVVQSVMGLLEQTESALRRLVFDVRPPALETPDGLAASIRDRLAMLEASGIKHELAIELPELGQNDRSMIFREVAEALGNVERHSQATLVRVSLTTSEGGVLGVVEDNGRGFVVADRSNLPGHLGLLALRERALMAGGRYKIESRPGAGTRIEFWIPIEK